MSADGGNRGQLMEEIKKLQDKMSPRYDHFSCSSLARAGLARAEEEAPLGNSPVARYETKPAFCDR